MTHALRYSKQSANTGDKLKSILSAVTDPKVEQIILFATPTKPTEDHSDSDGADTNLPEVAALAKGTIAGADVAVVFDGAFLSAARIPRYLEVKTLLDAAVESEKVYFASNRVPFTSGKTAADAATTFQSLGPFVKLTAATRPQYFSLLSNLTEAQLQQL